MTFPSLRSRLLSLVPCIAALQLACTAIHVEALPRTEPVVTHVCIERNPLVLVDDFLPAVRAGFERHGITTEIYDGAKPAACVVTVKYTARQTWDLVSFLAKAEIWIARDGQQIAYAEYHLRGGGGYALTKYQGAQTKMRPVMDQLLEEYGPQSVKN